MVKKVHHEYLLTIIYLVFINYCSLDSTLKVKVHLSCPIIIRYIMMKKVHHEYLLTIIYLVFINYCSLESTLKIKVHLSCPIIIE